MSRRKPNSTRASASPPAGDSPRKDASKRDPASGRRCRIVVAAHPALFCETLCTALGLDPTVEVAGRCHDEEEAFRVVRQIRPAVLVLDDDGFGRSVERSLRRLRRESSATRILVVATRADDHDVERAVRAGAAGLVGKKEPLATLVRAIRAVADGELWANRRATAHLVEQLSEPAAAPRRPDEELTPREWEITEKVGMGMRNKEIARGLKISEKTVKSHLNNIFRKLQVDNRFALGLYTLERLSPRS